MSAKKFASVLLDLALDKTLDYEIPPEWRSDITIGSRVEVPLRNTATPGYVLEIKESSSFPTVKPISRLISQGEFLPPDLFQLALWISRYYLTPLQKVLRIMVPSSIRAEKKAKQQLFVIRNRPREELQQHCIEIRNKSPAQATVLDLMLQVTKGILLSELLEKTGGTRSPIDTLAKQGFLSLDLIRLDRSPLSNEEYFPTKPKQLNEEQSAAFVKIQTSLIDQTFATHLIHGVTGSGKTEVYLQAIAQAQKQKKGTIVLVPEIALTIQTIERFRSRFEGDIAVLHHRLSDGERMDEWNKIRRGEATIVIGARSAIFSPVVNLGLIIVDEEHENSYKQSDEMPCYHARDVAVMRGKINQATVILGSATPSLESYHNAQQGKYVLSPLKGRADQATLPRVSIIDMKREYERAKGYVSFSEALIDGIKKRYLIGEQTILFLNRRGYHTSLMCQQCGVAIRCRQCELALTYHFGEDNLTCHLCGYTINPPPRSCPSCHACETMKYKGVGTEQIERALHAILPDIRTLRIDADTTRHKDSHRRLLQAFGTGKADLLIGTQMIAKGLHFPQVTLVGILNSDTSLNIPDFRASETVFQLITQVAGRAGRGALPGEVLIQTCMPDNLTIKHASEQNYEGFFQEEIQSRELFAYPPFSQLIKCVFSGENAQTVQNEGERVRKSLATALPAPCELLPLVPAGYAKIKGQYYFQFLVKGPHTLTIVRILNQMMENGIHKELSRKKVKVKIDVNPLSTFF